MKKKVFRIDWVLKNELAIGRAPRTNEEIELIKAKGIKCIFSLCSEDEASFSDLNIAFFHHERFVLPDHKCGRSPENFEIKHSYFLLEKLMQKGSVYIHCFAGMERSPLICLLWLVKKHQLTLNESLYYLKEAHPETNPLPEQLESLREYLKSS